MCICACVSLIIFYILTAKEIKYYKKESNEDDESTKQPMVKNTIKIGNIKLENVQGNPRLTNVINTYYINKSNKKLKNMNKDNLISNNINKNNNSSIKNIELYSNKNNSIINKIKKKTSLMTNFDENKNDESRIGLSKDLIINNKKEKVLKNDKNVINLKSENKIIKIEELLNKNNK